MMRKIERFIKMCIIRAVIPAKAGIQGDNFASLDPRLRGDDPRELFVRVASMHVIEVSHRYLLGIFALCFVNMAIAFDDVNIFTPDTNVSDITRACCDTVTTNSVIACELSQLAAQAAAAGECASTPITGQTTITESGTYCLQNDIAAAAGWAITINADNVTLNLNGFSITAIGSAQGILINGRKSVTIKNGVLASISVATTAVGVSVSGSQDVSLENLSFNTFPTNIQVTDSSFVDITSVACIDPTIGVQVQGASSDVTIAGCRISGATSTAITFAGTVSQRLARMSVRHFACYASSVGLSASFTDALVVEESELMQGGITFTSVTNACLYNLYFGMQTSGFVAVSMSSTTDVVVENCAFVGYADSFLGTAVADQTACNIAANCSRITVRDCPVTAQVSPGFFVDPAASKICLIDDNVNAFLGGVSGFPSVGFQLEGSDVLVRRCYAVNCGRVTPAVLRGTGFTRGLSTNVNDYFENIASLPTIAYGVDFAVGPIATPIESPANARGFDNVSASMTEVLDAVSVTLSKVTVLESIVDRIDSKVDVLLS